MNAIEVRGACKRYGDFALQDVVLTLPEGCVLGLIGENGAGKSTLIRMLMGACRPDAGTVRVLGKDAGQDAAFAAVRQQIGVVLDDCCLPNELNAAQIGKCMRGIYTAWDDAAFDALLRRFALPRDKRVRDFSRGMRMKLALAVALSHHAKLLVLDEATGGLDPIVRDELLDLFNDFAREQGGSILLSSHIVSDLEKICDYIVFLHAGQVALAGEKDSLLEDYALVLTDEAGLRSLNPADVVRVLRAHGAVRVLLARHALPSGMMAERMGLEDLMLMFTKGVRL